MFLALVAALGIAISSVSFSAPFSFIRADHPIEVLQDESGHWLVFDMPGDAEGVISNARTNLLNQGFREDNSERPWYRFTKGQEILIISRGDEIAINKEGSTGRPVHFSNPGSLAVETAVWVHEPGGSSFEYAAFEVKKTLLRW